MRGHLARYGGPPIGSFRHREHAGRPKAAQQNPRALFMDCSHDNELICDKFTHFCAIPIVAFVSMASSPTGKPPSPFWHPHSKAACCGLKCSAGTPADTRILKTASVAPLQGATGAWTR